MCKKRKIKKIIIFVMIIIIISAWIIWGTNSIVITNIEYKSSKIPEEFNGYKIVQISDLHSKTFGKNQSELISKIEQCKPNIIVITGDLVDSRKNSLNIAIEFVNQAVQIAPVYYVPGNHEAYNGNYSEIEKELLKANVIVLNNVKTKITKNGKEINVLGILDPYFYYYSAEVIINRKLEDLQIDDNSFNILLSHRPELIDVYAENDIDLAFTGHAHGGQVRIPVIGAIVAPNQGLFPKYTIGTYVKDNTTMIVNRGLGNSSLFPFRVFNRPEIIVVELQKN